MVDVWPNENYTDWVKRSQGTQWMPNHVLKETDDLIVLGTAGHQEWWSSYHQYNQDQHFTLKPIHTNEISI